MATHVFQKTKADKNTLKIAKKAFTTLCEIYDKDHYPHIEIIRPDELAEAKIEGEFALPRIYEDYLIREFKNFLDRGHVIMIQPGRIKLKKTDPRFLRNCEESVEAEKQKLFLFSPERIELSADRLKHYTKCDPDDFQEHVLITNYQMHLDIFKEIYPQAKGSRGSCQMPVLHVKKKHKKGISIINMGVGPSNAKTLTDQLAVLRPSCMIMIGHCGGLEARQDICDFLLADKFIRDDNVLDIVLPRHIPVTTTLIINTLLLNEIQKRKIHYKIGTVFTTNNRDWEYKITDYEKRFQASRAYGIDMESSVVCGQGFRYKIPNATLLMVSDKPLHGKPKLTKYSEKFYDQSKRMHVEIAVKAIESLDTIKRPHIDLSGLESYPGSHLHSLMW